MNLLAAVGDVTGDGKGDVLGRATRTGLTRVYRGDGRGHISRTGIYATRQFRSANLLAGAGDWNKDGKADVLMRTKTTGSLYVFHGTGQRHLRQPRLLSKGWAGYTSHRAGAGDLTGDGRPDVVGLKAGCRLRAPGTSHGERARRTQPADHVGHASANALVGGGRDLNGDGVGDVVVRSQDTGSAEDPDRQVRRHASARRSAASPVRADCGKLSAGQMGGAAAARRRRHQRRRAPSSSSCRATG